MNGIEVLISKALIDSDISHDELFFINNLLKEFHDMKDEIKNSCDKQKLNKLYIKKISSYCLKCIKKYKKLKSKRLKDWERRNNAFMKMCSM